MKLVTAPTSKYKEIFQNLLDSITSGEYVPGQRLPSEADLVKTYSTSRITVNRALRELQLAGFIDRRAGSGSYVRQQASTGYTFGLIIADLGRTEIFEPICRGMMKAQGTDGNHSLLWGSSLGDEEASAQQALELCRQLVAKKVSGVFFAPLELTSNKDSVNRSIVNTLDKAKIPIVLLDRDLVTYPARSPYDLIGIDNRRAGYMITAHLLRSGCKRVAFVARPRSAPTVDARISGYREAILAFQTSSNADKVCRFEPGDVDAVRRMMDEVRPDGVVCANDFTAAQLMRVFNELKVAVPDQVRVGGIDDVKYASLLPVPLTTIHQPCEKMGAIAIAVMIERLRNPDLPARDILLDFHVVVRESCGAAKTRLL